MIYPTAKSPPNHIPTSFTTLAGQLMETATCMQTDTIGVGSNFHVKTVWWKVDLGAVYSIHSINIQFRNYNGYGLCFFTIYVCVIILNFITMILSLSGIKYILV